jgi:HEAT repeat protein
MKSTRLVAAPLALLLLNGLACAAPDDPFTGLKTYDSQKREPVAAVRKMIQQSLSDKAKLADIEQRLIGVLEDPAATFAGKQEVCRMLWVIGTSRSVPALAKMLGDEKLGNAARYALERNPDPSAEKALRDALGTTSGGARVGVINSLGDRGDAEAVPGLTPLGADKDAQVSEAAISALGKIGTGSALMALQGLPSKNVVTGQAMLHCADRLAVTGKRSDAERVYADLATTGQPPVQIAALRGLVTLQSPKASPIALAALKSPDGEVQVAAASSCILLKDEQTTKQAITAWPTLPAPVQVALLAGWADRPEPAAAPLAEQAIASQDAILRTTGIHAAAKIAGARAVPTLAKVAAQGTDPDKQTARTSLATLPGKEAEQTILRLAQRGDPQVRVALTDVLADRGTPGARKLLLEEANGSDEKLATEAVKALGRAGGPQDHDALVKVLATTKSDMVRDAVQGAVVASAQRLGDRDRAAAPVLAALPGASAPVRASLIATLAEIGGDQSLVQITKATTDAAPEVKSAAITGLAETWGDSRPLPTLLGIAKSDPNKTYRMQALRGYLRLVGQDDKMPADEKVAKIQEAMAIAERPEERRQALGVLRDCRVPSALDLAAKSLDDAAVFDEAADTVLYLAAPQKKGDTNLAAVKGSATTAALDKVARLAKDDSMRTKAQALL